MITYFIAFLCSLMIGCGMTVAVRGLAFRLGWLDHALTSRKSHERPVPRIGGLAILVAFYAPLCALLFVESGVGSIFRNQPDLLGALFGAGVIIGFVGLYDDIHGMRARYKLVAQILLATVLYLAGFRIEAIANPFGPSLQLGVLSYPLSLAWIVGVVNAMNLIDGLDGLAGGVAFFAIGTNFVLAVARGDVLMALTMAALGGAVLGFLVFNFNPASIFMGDSGSMFLGFVLATVSLKTSAKSGTAVALLVPIIALGLPIMDTLLAMVRRSLVGRPVLSADKEHIHHRLSQFFLSQRRAVLVLYALCFLFALTALALSFASSVQSAMLLAGVGLVVVVLMRRLGYLKWSEAAVVRRIRQRNVHLRTVVNDVNDRIAKALDHSQLWDAIRDLAEELNLSHLRLQLEQQTPRANYRFDFETKRETEHFLPVEAKVAISWRDVNLGMLSVTWQDGRTEVNRDEELAIELIADSIGKAMLPLHKKPVSKSNVISFPANL